MQYVEPSTFVLMTRTAATATASSYSYSPQGSLAGLIHNLSGTAQDVAYTYACNQAQEITTQTWSNDAYQWRGAVNGVRGYSANGLNQYTSVAGAALGFDAGGNLKSDGTWRWAYDADNQLRSASRSGTSVSLAYDAAGRLRREVLNAGTATQFLYDGADLVGEYDAAGALLRRYVHGPGVDEPLVAYTGSGTANKEWLYADHLGSVVASANPAGTSTAVYSYGPFGEPNQSAGTRFRWVEVQSVERLEARSAWWCNAGQFRCWWVHDPVKDTCTPLPQSLASRLWDSIFNQVRTAKTSPAFSIERANSTSSTVIGPVAGIDPAPEAQARVSSHVVGPTTGSKARSPT